MYCNPIAIAEELKHKTSLQNKAKLGDEVILLQKTDNKPYKGFIHPMTANRYCKLPN